MSSSPEPALNVCACVFAVSCGSIMCCTMLIAHGCACIVVDIAWMCVVFLANVQVAILIFCSMYIGTFFGRISKMSKIIIPYQSTYCLVLTMSNAMADCHFGRQKIGALQTKKHM